MKRIGTLLLALCLVFSLCAVTALAADSSRSYDFDLTINGSHEVQAKPGDVLTVSLTLRRTDASEAALMYAMQDEIYYDDSFFEVVEGSLLVSGGIEGTNIALQSGGRAQYLNYLSLGGGENWQAETLVGSFQVKVLAQSGASTLRNMNAKVSVQNGTDSYAATVQDVTVVVSTDCTVNFESNGGSKVESQTVHYGETVTRPKDPTREGYQFTGWYKDLNLKEAWDFAKDTVSGNMTLYAGWTKATAPLPGNGSVKTGGGVQWWLPALLLAALLALIALLAGGKKTVDFETNGGSEMESVLVKRGRKLRRPTAPVKDGAVFGGWYRDAACTKPWNFAEDTVKHSMTLYAKWNEA